MRPVLPSRLLFRPAWTLCCDGNSRHESGCQSKQDYAQASWQHLHVNCFSLIGHFFYFGASSRSRAVKYSWLCCILKIRLISTPRLFSSSASSLSFLEEQHKHVLPHVLNPGAGFRDAGETPPRFFLKTQPWRPPLPLNPCLRPCNNIGWISVSVLRNAIRTDFFPR